MAGPRWTAQTHPPARRPVLLRVLALLVVMAAVVAWPAAANAHGEEVDIVVETLTTSAEGEVHVDFGIALTFADGDVVSDADVALRALPPDDVAVQPVTNAGPGVYLTTVRFPAPGSWTIVITFDHPDATGAVELTHLAEGSNPAVPWVLVDTIDPAREGGPAGQESRILEPPAAPGVEDIPHVPPTPVPRDADVDSSAASSSTSSPSAAAAPEHEADNAHPATEASQAAITVSSPTDELRRNVALRLGHLASITLWAVPVAGALFGRRGRLWEVVALTGMGLTLTSGVLLALWGTPLTFPGILRWDALGERSYGSPYRIAFVAKTSVVGLGAIATLWWVRRRSPRAVWLVALAFAGAVVAVTAMTQLHLLIHA